MCKSAVSVKFDNVKCHFLEKSACYFSGKIQMWSKKSPNLKTSDPSPSPQNYDVILKNSEIFNLEKIFPCQKSQCTFQKKGIRKIHGPTDTRTLYTDLLF